VVRSVTALPIEGGIACEETLDSLGFFYCGPAQGAGVVAATSDQQWLRSGHLDQNALDLMANILNTIGRPQACKP
jgi:hypothetical protein